MTIEEKIDFVEKLHAVRRVLTRKRRLEALENVEERFLHDVREMIDRVELDLERS